MALLIVTEDKQMMVRETKKLVVRRRQDINIAPACFQSDSGSYDAAVGRLLKHVALDG